MKLSIFLLAALVATASAASVPFTNCGSSSDKASVSSIEATPFPPVKGKEISITAAGELKEDLTGGTYHLVVTFDGIQLLKQTGDLCTLDPAFKCPHKAGSLSLTKSLTLPSFTPSGNYKVHLEATDSSSNELLCVEVALSIKLDEEQEQEQVGTPLETTPAVSREMVNKINNAETTWVAGFQRRFEGMTLADVAHMCGTRPGGVELPQMRPASLSQLSSSVSIPESFTAADNWPQCKSLSQIRDQGSCGSCWAVSSAETMTDRLCISTNATTSVYLSAADVMSCCGSFCGDGCGGGYPSAAWSYFDSTGVVSGGPYGSGQGCLPYTVPSCDHHVPGPNPCGAEVPTPSCPHTCQNSAQWQSDKHRGSTAYSVPNDVETIQRELMTNGPITAAFSVFADFPTYKSGVYSRNSNQFLGGHAVKIVGWGVDNGTPFWRVANSWNPTWGDQGYFNIIRSASGGSASGDCGITQSLVAGSI